MQIQTPLHTKFLSPVDYVLDESEETHFLSICRKVVMRNTWTYFNEKKKEPLYCSRTMWCVGVEQYYSTLNIVSTDSDLSHVHSVRMDLVTPDYLMCSFSCSVHTSTSCKCVCSHICVVNPCPCPAVTHTPLHWAVCPLWATVASPVCLCQTSDEYSKAFSL